MSAEVFKPKNQSKTGFGLLFEELSINKPSNNPNNPSNNPRNNFKVNPNSPNNSERKEQKYTLAEMTHMMNEYPSLKQSEQTSQQKISELKQQSQQKISELLFSSNAQG